MSGPCPPPGNPNADWVVEKTFAIPHGNGRDRVIQGIGWRLPGNTLNGVAVLERVDRRSQTKKFSKSAAVKWSHPTP